MKTTSDTVRMVREVRSVHFIGICGVAMGTLAGMMKQSGYEVTGSDEHIYPPMSDMLRGWSIPVRSGYSADNIGSPDLVVIGNAISRGNPEAEHVLNADMPYMSMARAIHDFFLRGREVISVSGTHGKTTTTALLAHILVTAGLDPSFLAGGVAVNYNSNYRLGAGRHFVIEGDEYDSAFFEKVPKFTLYRPRHCLLTSLEFDHADIYRDLDEIKLWFRRLVNIIPSKGELVYSLDYPALKEVTRHSLSSRSGFGKADGDYSWRAMGFADGLSRVVLKTPGEEIETFTPIFGEFNYANLCAAAAMAHRLGVDKKAIIEAARTFRGVKRRQELLFDGDVVKIYEDFAHHPTAIDLVLRSMRERHPLARLWALYEPRSATSRRNVFQESLPDSFAHADRVLIKRPFRLEVIREEERIDIDRVIADMRSHGMDASLHDEVATMVDSVTSEIDDSRENVIIIMSNGGFDGIYGKITDALRGLPVN